MIKNNRIAVATFFFVNGFLYANWTARLPELQSFFGVSNTGLGSLLLVSAMGALIAMPFAGWMTTQFGTKRITTLAALILCAVVPFVPMYANLLIISFLFFTLGLASGAMDVAMNGQAVFVERKWGKPIMSSFHAIFSIGMALGAFAGSWFANIHTDLTIHFFIVAGIGIIACVVAANYLVKDTPSSADLALQKEDKSESSFRLPTKAILPLGIIAFCGMTGEGSMADWSAIFMHNEIGESLAFSALAFGSFSVAMTIGRIFGDYFTEKLGKRKLLICDSLIAIAGLSIALIFATAWTTLLGFFLVGLGLATVVPIIYSAAGNTEGVSPSVGIAMATTIGYAGFFVGPPTIGFLADVYGLRIGLCFTLLLFTVMFGLILRWKD
ncbi:MAG: MFS transporter [Chitinophagales bacterium]